MEELTQREIEVISLLVLGLTNQEISKNLIISEHTTKTHLSNIYRKLNVKNKVQATIKVFKLGYRFDSNKKLIIL